MIVRMDIYIHCWILESVIEKWSVQGKCWTAGMNTIKIPRLNGNIRFCYKLPLVAVAK